MDPLADLTRSEQDYLKAIYALTLDEAATTTNALSARMQVAPPSVTRMLQKLAAGEPPLVDYSKRHGVALTPAGRTAALGMLRRHRLLESFLLQVMGYTWDEVHAEAEQLEHVISQHFEARMADLLGDPQFDPHGDPIPAADLALPGRALVALSQLPEAGGGVVRRVRATAPEVLIRLGELGIRPGAALRVAERRPLEGTLRLSFEATGGEAVLGLPLADQVDVERAEG
ncbi:MAG: metal-dependent transcriptional regulator [Anaerolineae bacterium]|nr:metal-dependent transcriptional regulator [Anaerolineae bacterium]